MGLAFKQPDALFQFLLAAEQLLDRPPQLCKLIFFGKIHAWLLYYYTRRKDAMSESGFPLPPPTFEFLVFSLKMQAEVKLGLFSLGGEEENEGPDFAAARHAIDLMGMLAEKTKGNLSMEEQRLLENSLTELRFRFVQVESEAKTEPKDEAKSSEASPE